MQIYLNGELTDAASATVSAFDLGFTMGVSVTEQIRTYNRKTPLLDRHLDRFFGGLKIIGLTLPFDRAQLESQISDLIRLNGQSVADTDELGIGVCATPGIASAYGQTNAGPTTLVYTYPLIAELNDADGFIAEGTTASVVMIQSGRLVAPLKETVLPGVTLGVAIELAQQIGVPVERRNISVKELQDSDEAMWLTTPVGIIPVTHVNQNLIGDGNTGSVTSDLIAAWNAELNQ